MTTYQLHAWFRGTTLVDSGSRMVRGTKFTEKIYSKDGQLYLISYVENHPYSRIQPNAEHKDVESIPFKVVCIHDASTNRNLYFDTNNNFILGIHCVTKKTSNNIQESD